MSIISYFKSHSVLAGGVLFVAVVTAIIVGREASTNTAVVASDTNTKHVSLVDVASFRNGTSTISADGVVEAQSQADLKTQIGAPIASINVAVGDNVSAGQIILQLESSDIQAQLGQVQGQYSSTREATIQKIQDAYLTADDAVHAQIDQLIINTSSPKPQFYAYVIDQQLGNRIREERGGLETIFNSWKPAVNALSATSSDASIQAAIVLSQSGLDKITDLLNDMSKVLSDAANAVTTSNLPAINAMQAIVTGARTSVSSARQTLSTATVGIAQAGVQSLQAQLDKTIIRSPISGQISALPLRTGEFASPGTLVATVIGGAGFQVKAYASGEDLARLKVGAAAIIQGSVPGIVTSVAPSVSAINRKVEVNIRLTDPSGSALVVGQNVQARIRADKPAATSAQALAYMVPIQDVKIIPGEAYVYTVDADNKVVKHAVTLGKVQGDFLEVATGLTDGMMIVSPVYELEEGQQVIVQ